MEPLQIILLLIGVVLVIEGFVVSIDPKWVRSVTHKLLKNKSLVRTLGIIELIVGAIIFWLAIR